MGAGPSPSPGRNDLHHLIEAPTSANAGKERSGVAAQEEDYDEEYGDKDYEEEEEEEDEEVQKGPMKQDSVKEPTLNISKRPSKFMNYIGFH